jgi:hypothetical protein
MKQNWDTGFGTWTAGRSGYVARTVRGIAPHKLIVSKDYNKTVKITPHKLIVPKDYNKTVKIKSFQVGDLVWKRILPLRSNERKFGKNGLHVGKGFTELHI